MKKPTKARGLASASIAESDAARAMIARAPQLDPAALASVGGGRRGAVIN